MATDDSTAVQAPSLLDEQPEKTRELEAYIATLPLAESGEKRRGFLIQCLHRAQEIFGYLPEEVQLLIANRLSLHLSEVYAVISFYSFFTTTPVGKFKINICLGTACFVKGAGPILAELKQQLKLSEGETSADRKFSLGSLRCVGACSLAPVVMVNDRVYGNVTREQISGMLQDCK